MATFDDSNHSLNFQQAYQDCCNADIIKANLFQKMISRVRTLEHSFDRKSAELEQQTTLLNLYYGQVKDQELELKTIRRRQEQSNFVLVLIDGDIILFQDEYIKKGEAGGTEAARNLRTAVQQYLDSIELSCKIMINIYANISGLKKIHSLTDIYGFIRGFNMFDGLCQIIEAGNGKECADEKVKRSFEIFINNTHCKRIIFGGSGDNGYARLLLPFVSNKSVILLEGPPLARELANLDPPFDKIAFKEIFRSTKIEMSAPTVAVSSSLVSNSEERPLVINTTMPQSPGTWATKASIRSPSELQETINISRQTSHPFPNGFDIYRNSKDERVDESLSVPPAEIQRIKSRKLCNQYHLFNACSYGERCTHQHGPRLTERDFQAQRALARKTPCNEGLGCKDPWCSSGHRCQSGKLCVPSTCWFPERMHDVDVKTVKVVRI